MNNRVGETEIAEMVAQYFQSPPPLSRRILTDFETLSLDAALQTPAGKILQRILLQDADRLLDQEPMQRIMVGVRLLGVSRNVLFRVTTLVMAWKLSGEEKYARRGVKEMLAAAAFSDWNPAHFLDVGEMAIALAVGAAALDPVMTPEERKIAADALWEKGIWVSLPENANFTKLPADRDKKYLWWIDSCNNWAPVCHAGIVAAALIAGDRDPATAARVICRAVENIPISMVASYSPNGAYPEGPGYWGYGTDFTCILLGLLDNAFGTDFGLSEIAGWKDTGKYLQAAIAPSGYPYNYSDGTGLIAPGFAWFFLESRYPGTLPFSPGLLEKMEQNMQPDLMWYKVEYGRLLPLAMYCLKPQENDLPEVPLWYYSGDSSTMPLVMFRSSGAEDAVYLGIKGGTPSAPHGHMDSGSFILEADGVRWAVDLGMESYHALEERGMSLWWMAQESDRWKVFRIGPDSHNILRINGAPQLTSGWGKVTEMKPDSVCLDLSTLYENIGHYERRASISENSVEIRDLWQGVPAGSVIRFQFCTCAAAEIAGDRLTLRQDGKTLYVFAGGARWETAPASHWMHEWDSDNGDAKMVWFEIRTEDNTGEIAVSFSRQEIK